MNNFKSAKEEAEWNLRNFCFELKLNEHDTEMAVDYFIHRLSHKEVAQKYNIEYQTSCNKKLHLKKKLKVYFKYIVL